MKTAPVHMSMSRRQLLGAMAAGLMATTLVAQTGPASAASVIFGKDRWLFPGWESLTSFDQAGVESASDLIGEAGRALATRNVKLITVIAPLKARFYADKLPDDAKMSDGVMKQYDAILQALKKQGVEVVDLRPALKSVETGKQTSFYRADYHWTAWSAEAAADAVAQAIKDSKVPLKGQRGTGDKIGAWVTQRHYGDLAERFLTPEQKKQIGPELFTVRVAPEAQGGLIDTAQSPVHIVGNSFVQPYLGFPQKLSNDLDRPVSLTWNPGNVGPWLTFLQYVESPDFSRNPPQFLVWLFNEGAFHSTPDSTQQWDVTSIMTPQQWRSRMEAAVRK